MAFAMAAAALMVITMATATALMLRAFLMLAVGVTVIAVTVATAAARASTYLLLHAVGNLFIGGGNTFINSKAEVLIYSSKQVIKLLASLKETAAGIILYHVLTQGIELGDFLL